MASTNTITVEGSKGECYRYQVTGSDIVAADHKREHFGRPSQAVRKLYPKPWLIRWAQRDSGQYHPRIFMGDYFEEEAAPPMTAEIHRAFSQLQEHDEILTEDLREIARVVAPVKSSQKVFGSRIRNLLIMACTEVEAQCKAILVANGYPKNPRDMKMPDYRSLAKPMKLGDFKVGIARFPDYPPRQPFKSWAQGKPLQWYQAYNRTKHDAEKYFSAATLEHAVDAVIAVSLLQLAQYGNKAMRDSPTPFLELHNTPFWSASQRTYPPFSGQAWTPIKRF